VEIIWNIIRRQLRSALTISGIVIGSFALVLTRKCGEGSYYAWRSRLVSQRCREFLLFLSHSEGFYGTIRDSDPGIAGIGTDLP
jgi:hypothetical protein